MLECRELQAIFNYADWRNFLKVIDKAKTPVEKVERWCIDMGSGSQREIEDVALIRYTCYLLAQNGNLTKIKTNETCSSV